MLILTRKQGEKIKIGDDIEITIIEISQGNVKIGVEAPKKVKVIRYELIEELREQNRNAIENIDGLICKFKKEG